MSLQVMKSLARTPPGCLHCIKQDFGVEQRVTATYVPLLCNLGGLGSAPGPDTIDPVSDRLKPAVDCLDDLCGQSKTDFSLHVPSPFSTFPFVSAPMGHLSCSRKGLGQDIRLSVVYSPKQEDCLEIGFQVPSCLDGGLKRGGYVNPSS